MTMQKEWTIREAIELLRRIKDAGCLLPHNADQLETVIADFEHILELLEKHEETLIYHLN